MGLSGSCQPITTPMRPSVICLRSAGFLPRQLDLNHASTVMPP
jgi:hypothetical protein